MALPEFTLHHLLLNSAERFPDKEAVVDGSQRITYEALANKASGLAAALRSQGLRRGDRVGVYLEKTWEAAASILGIAQAGGVFVNIGPLLRERQVQHIVADSSMRMLVSDPAKIDGFTLPQIETTFFKGATIPAVSWSREALSLSEAFEGAHNATETPATEKDLATIIYTSGSTGLPKGIMISHHNLVAGAQIVSSYLGNTADDRVLAVLPLNFDYGLNQLTTMIRVGGTIVLQRSLLPGEILKSLRGEAITGLAGMPPIWTVLLQARRSLMKEPLRALRYLTNSAGTIPQSHLDAMREMLPETDIFLMYGLTEGFRATYLPPSEIDRGSTCIGKAIPNTDIRVVDEDGSEVAPGETGELIQAGPTVALGYWRQPEKTAEVYRSNPLAIPEMSEGDPVIYSGDLVKRGEDGFMYFIGRKDEQIKTQGFRVSPGEVEDLLSSVPGVSEAVAFGRKDEVMGQAIVAVISSSNGDVCTEGSIRTYLGANAPQYLIPRDIHIVDEIPRTATGKFDRSALRHEFTATGD